MIIAMDFDGTLCELAYPNIDEARVDVISKVQEAKEKGHTLILNTCREGIILDRAISWLQINWGLEFDYVNENYKENLANYPYCRKIAADIYVDDLAPGSVSYFLEMKLCKVKT